MSEQFGTAHKFFVSFDLVGLGLFIGERLFNVFKGFGVGVISGHVFFLEG